MLRRSSAPFRMRRNFGLWTLLLMITAATLAGVLGVHTLGDQAAALGHQSTVTSVAQSATEASLSHLPALADATERVGVAGPDGVLTCELLVMLSAVTALVLLLQARGPIAVFFTSASTGADGFRLPAEGIGARPVSLTVLGISRI